MRKFITLFLLALAMTIGANQAFAGSNTGPNDTGKQERPDRNGGDDDNDDDGGEDPTSSRERLTLITVCEMGARGCFQRPRHRHRKPKRHVHVVQVEPEDCGCEHKVIRVGARFVTVLDCYQSILVNGREQLRYCRKDG